MGSNREEAQKFLSLQGTFWIEALFAWGALLVSISPATALYTAVLAMGYQPVLGMLVAATTVSILISGAFLLRQQHRKHLARRIATNPHLEIEQLLQALKRLPRDDRQEVIRRVLDEYEGKEDNRYDQERRMQLFGLYLLGCSIFLIASLNAGRLILTGHSQVNPFLDIALLISAGVMVEMVLRAIRALRTHTAESLLKRLLGLA